MNYQEEEDFWSELLCEPEAKKNMAIKPKPKSKAAPTEDFETFRERVLLLARQDAPEPSKQQSAVNLHPAKSVKLYYTDKSVHSDKVYTLAIVKEPKYAGAYYVNFTYGKRNGTLKDGTKTKIAVKYEEAVRIYNYFLKEKKDEGYTENVSGIPFSM